MARVTTELTPRQSAADAWKSINWPARERLVRRLQERIFRVTQRGQWKAAKNLQKLLARSESAKLLAIRRVTQENTGKITPGIDGKVYLTPEERWKWSQEEKFCLRGYQPQPAKRGYVPKASGGKRPLGIPVMKDRVMEAIVKLAMEPEFELKFEPNSYGFRPGRSCWDAIEQVRNCITRKEGRKSSPIVLDADIAGCFDNIAHEPLLERIPAHFRGVVRRWLRVGGVEMEHYEPTVAGTPQGGVISPLLANIALDGMERIFGIEDQEGNYLCPSKRPGNRGISLVRYADDFLAFGRNPYEVEWYARPKVQRFLASRGLALSEIKTRVTTRDKGFNFLGFTIRQVWTKYHKILLVTPQKEKVKNFLARVKAILSANKQATVEGIIRLLNPVIRGWAQYYSHCNAKRTFSSVDNQIFKKIWHWCVRRHPDKGRRWVKGRYFMSIGGRHWVFGESPALRLVSAAEMPITRHVKVRGYASPFDPTLKDYWDLRAARKVQERYLSKKKKMILETQGYRCWHCGRAIREEDRIHFHHKIPRHEGGTDEAWNLHATHQYCHQKLHKHSDYPFPKDCGDAGCGGRHGNV